MKNIRVFYLKIFRFLEVKFSIYLNRRVFVMMLRGHTHAQINVYMYLQLEYLIQCLNNNIAKRLRITWF